MEFSIEAWAAFAPGIGATPEAWQAWARQPHPPHGDAQPALAEMAPMQRRRVDRLGRMALQVAWQCQPDPDPGMPLVFASRHGDLARTYAMLGELARDEPLSPTHFGLSTHNAIAAQYSIARTLTGNYTVVSAGAATAEAAVVEALALLADGARAVLVVVYDGPTPDDYAAFRDEPEGEYAWAWRVVPPRAGLPVLELGRASAGLPAPETEHGRSPASGRPAVPHGLDVLRFLLAGDATLAVPGDGGAWHRHA